MKNPVFDKDLTPLFRGCSNIDLDPIVQIILSAPSQTLTVQPAWRDHSGDHHCYVDELVYEVTSFGGNSLANLVRGHGLPYAELVRNLADELALPRTIADTTATLEMKIILRVLKLSYERLGPDDRTALQEILEGGEDPDGAIDFSDGFPEQAISDRLGSAGKSLLGDRIGHAVDAAAHATRIRRSVLGLVRTAVTKVATASLGGAISWTIAIGEAMAQLFGPNRTVALALTAQIGLLRQEKAHIVDDTVAENQSP